MKRVLLLLPTTGYRNDDFLAAAKNLGVEIVAAANYCHRLAPSWGLPPIMALHFDQPEQAADTVLRQIGGVFETVKRDLPFLAQRLKAELAQYPVP